MKISKIEDIIHITRCFHYTSQMPIKLYLNNKNIFSIPENIKEAKTILGINNVHLKIQKTEDNIDITINEYKETEIIVNKNNIKFIIGPILYEKIESGTITNMIRNNIIPFHQKSIMQDYYNNCLIANNEKIYYATKTLKMLIDDIEIDIKTINKTKTKNIDHDDTLKKQLNKYRQDSFLHSPYFIEQEICKNISNGDVINSKRLLQEINIQPHAQLAESSLRSYKNSMICSCSFMTRAAISGGLNPDEAFSLSDAYINEIEKITTTKELEDLEFKMVEGFTNKVLERKNNQYSNPITKCIYYIENHLCENITINDLAKNVYLNPSYLSNIFHKETGVTISDWILKKRIEESANLLSNTNDKIADIAFFYKFCSQSYYVQCFKRIMGTTPGEYRKKSSHYNN